MATLLGLPTELRLRIYEFTYDATVIGEKLVWNDRFTLNIHGSQAQDNTRSRIVASPFTLLRVCRALHYELSPLLPKIEDIIFHFNNLTKRKAEAWLGLMGRERIACVRHLKINGWDRCYSRRPMYVSGHRYNCQYVPANVCTKACLEPSINDCDTKAKHGLCDRSLIIDLTVFERDFNADAWNRLLGADHRVQSISGGFVGDSAYHPEYYKGYYLLRILDGCVTLPPPEAHPARQSNQCNSVVDIQLSLSGLVHYDGRLNVNKRTILGLVESILGDGFQGGSSERYLRIVTNPTTPSNSGYSP